MRKLAFLCLVVVFYSCFPPHKKRVYIKEGTEIGFIKKVAVLPFENHTKEQHAAERVRDIVITEMLVQGIFDVVDKGLVDATLSEEALELKSSIDAATARRLARMLGVQAFVSGSVEEYKVERKGMYSYPVVVVTLRLVDGTTGKVFWQVTGMESGYSFLGRMFGIRSKDITEVTFRLIKRLVSTLK